MKRITVGFQWAVPIALCVALMAVISGSVADTPPQLTITAHLGGVETQKAQDWEAAWLADNSAAEVRAVEAVVQLSKLDRQIVKQELAIASQQEKYQAIKRNLDIGRHELLKRVIAAAIIEANKRLDEQKLTRLKQLTLINCGGVGDFARDQDITAFADDPLRERVFFESLLEVADSMGIKGEPQNKTLGLKSGINFHGLEVTFHAGKNDLPDTASTTERMSFALDYRKVIESQAKAPEAYFGYGAELEVQANRIAIPGTASKTKMQVFRCEDGVTVRYTGVLQASAEDVNGVTRYTRGSRVRAAQHAVHMTNNFLQATRHSLDPASTPSQGPLKYAGRTLDHLCQLRGMEPWSKLELPDRIELLRPLFPADLADAQIEKLATSMARHLDVAEMTLRNKVVPEVIGKVPVDPAVSAKVASIFMRKAAAQTAKHLATEMLQPPPFDHDLMPRLAAGEGKNWHHLSLAEKGVLARKYDKSYQENVSIAAMENLLVTMRCLKDLDALDNRGVGSQAIAEVVNSARPVDPKDPRQKQLYELMKLAADHAETTVEREQSTDPNVRRALGQLHQQGTTHRRGRGPHPLPLHIHGR